MVGKFNSGFASLFALLLIAAGGAGFIIASDHAKPGDPLYGVDLAMEDFGSIFHSLPTDQASYMSELALERAHEAEQLVKENAEVHQIQEALTRAQQHTVSANVAVGVAKSQGHEVDQVLQTLAHNSQTSQELLANVSQSSHQGTNQTVNQTVEHGIEGLDHVSSSFGSILEHTSPTPTPGSQATTHRTPQAPVVHSTPNAQSPVQDTAGHGEQLWEGITDCRNVETVLNHQMGSTLELATHMHNQVDAISRATEDYYASHVIPAGGVLENHVILLANIGAKKLAVTNAIQTASDLLDYNCAEEHPKERAQHFREAMVHIKDTLSEHKEAVGHFVQQVHSVSSTTDLEVQNSETISPTSTQHPVQTKEPRQTNH